MTCWQVLGIARTPNRGDIRRAYAAKLKLTNPEDDPEGFKTLRAAYDQALAHADDEGRSTPAIAPVMSPPILVPSLETIEWDERHVDRADHVARLDALRLLLQGDGDGNGLQSAFTAVITSRAMEALDVRFETETHIAWLLAHNVPRSDSLIGTASDHFRWTSDDALVHKTHAVHLVLQRAQDLALRHTLTSGKHRHRGAFKVLSRPPCPITLRSRLVSPATPEAIKAFLNTVVQSQPTLMRDLNGDTVNTWRVFFNRPQIATWGLWSLVLTGPALLLGILFLTAIPADYRGWGILTLLPPALAAASLAYTFGADLPQQTWRKGKVKTDEPWLRWGWAAGMVILLLIVAPPTEDWLLAPLAVMVAVITGSWVAVVGEPDKRPGRLPWLARALLSEFYLVIWGGAAIFSLSPPNGVSVAAMLAAATMVSAFGRIPMYRLWSTNAVFQSRAPALGLAVVAAFAILALWAMQPFPEFLPASIALVAIVTLLYRGFAPSTTPPTFYIHYFMALIFAWGEGDSLAQGIIDRVAFVPAGGTMLLAWIFYPMANRAFARRTSVQ